MYHRGIFKNITYRLKNTSNEYTSTFARFTVVLFNFIEGKTLADAYPFSDDILNKVAQSIANIHRLTPQIDLISLPKEAFDVSFVASLIKCMNELEQPVDGCPIALALRELLAANQELIQDALHQIIELREKVSCHCGEFVLCHGDMWGGNLISHDDDLYVIDWESAVVAPIEYDLYGYIGGGFEVFFTAYEIQRNRPVTLNPDLLRFYSYCRHLRNLTNWLTNIRYGNHSEEQNNNDLVMIRDH
jgi:thiamine kinase-like enzyme